MPATYKDFHREPSKPHQCMHHSEKDGTRCRAASMHNEYMCYHHRSDDIPTVIQNDPFLIETLDNHASVQKALTDIAARLACNHIDLKRAGLLLQAIQIASTNLRQQSQPNPPAPEEADSSTEAPPDSKSVTSTEGANAPALTSVISTESGASVAPVEKPALSSPKAPPHSAPAQPATNKQQPSTVSPPQPATDNLRPVTGNRLPRCERNRRRHWQLASYNQQLTTSSNDL